MPPPEQQIFEFEPIKGFPYLHWKGKQPYTSTQYFPAQSKECIGEEQNGWINRLYYGDNLQVMSHLMKEFRGKIDLIYIDPPFDSKVDYKRKIELRGKKVESDLNTFEDKMYGDIWSNDEYLQFMFERLILMRELLSDKGSIFLHCDWHKSHHLRMIMDEVFGHDNFINEIIWCYYGPGSPGMKQFNRKHDNIFWYGKNKKWKFNENEIRIPHDEKTQENFKEGLKGSGFIDGEYNLAEGKIPEDWWIMAIAGRYANDGIKRVGYPTEKPYKLAERIITATTENGDIVMDCFMGSGVTPMMAMKLGRKFIGADINLGAIQTTMKRLSKIKKELDASPELGEKKYTSFRIFNVNNYDFFNNPVQAKELLIEALGIQEPINSCYDGSKDGRDVKIMPIERIASKADITALVANLPYNKFEERKDKNPHEPVLYITLICMGHDPELKAELEKQLSSYKIDVEIVDILRNGTVMELKRESEADVRRKGNKLIIKKFYPMNLMQKLSLERTNVSDWKELVDSVMIDFNFDGVEMQPTVIDVPEKDGLVKGEYDIPKGAGRIKVKITDLISEPCEVILE